jgi:ABC-2 type transport system permease protein
VKHFFSLLRHEIRVLLISPATYIGAVLFLGLMGAIFQDLLAGFVSTASDASPAVEFFRYFFVPAIGLTPLLTMRSLAEERRLGTIETLMTTPVTTAEVVLAKYVASYLFYLGLWASTLSFFWVLFHFAEDPRVIDIGPLIGGYIFVALSALMYIAIGIFASAVTRSQLIAALLAFALTILVTVGSRYLPEIIEVRSAPNSLYALAIDHVQMFQQETDFVNGKFDTRAPVLYASLAGLFLFLSMMAVDARSARN